MRGNMDYNKLALEMHKENKGKISTTSKIKVETRDDLSIAYTPGVAEPCREIHKNEDDVYKYTFKSNMVAVVTNGTAVLGLGDIGPKAALPVMEGKAVLFKEFADVDAFPICLDTKDVDEVVRAVELIAPGFGGINLEDIAAPKCFEIEEKLKKKLDIPVFHDDQHGTAIVTLAAIINSLKLTKKKMEELNIVINGAGSAGIAIAKLLLKVGVNNIVLCNRKGAIHISDKYSLNYAQVEIARKTNKYDETGTLSDVIKDKDVFIGVSAPGVVTEEMVQSMADKSVVLAMANPIPEIMPDIAKKAGAFIVGSGRSDFANQVNNVLAFPGVFRGALDNRVRDITDEMKINAAYAIAETIQEEDLSVDNILPNPLNKEVAKNIAKKIC